MVDSKKINDKIELVEDPLLSCPEFKKGVAIPYFKDIFRDLTDKSQDGTQVVSRSAFLSVSIPHS